MSRTVAIIQGSLRPESRTAIVAQEVERLLKKHKITPVIVDLRTIAMEFCDGRDLEAYGKDLQAAHATLAEASAVVIGMPVYQYSVSGPLKNFLDIVSSAIERKPMAIYSNAGGIRSTMASSHLMDILAFECRCTIVQPVVHSWAEDFKNGKISSTGVLERLEEMVDDLARATS